MQGATKKCKGYDIGSLTLCVVFLFIVQLPITS